MNKTENKEKEVSIEKLLCIKIDALENGDINLSFTNEKDKDKKEIDMDYVEEILRRVHQRLYENRITKLAIESFKDKLK